MTAVYRMRQGLRALLAFTRAVDEPLASAYLTPDLLALFKQMQRSEQLHSLNVLRAVLAQGPTPRDLAAAALLHDVGKSRYPLRLWQKTLAVLLRKALPDRARRWGAGDPSRRWLRPFVVYAQHPAWSAALIAPAGASPVTIWLVAHHADDPADWDGHPHSALLRRLRAADDTS